MSGNIIPVNGGQQPVEPWSLEAWQAQSISTIDLGNGLAFRVRQLDVMELLMGEDQLGNPYINTLQQYMGGDTDTSGANLMQDQKALKAVQGLLDHIMVKAIVEPPLAEQGHENGIALASIKLEHKFEVLSGLMGGEDLVDKIQNFRQEPGAGVLAGPPIQEIREVAERGDGNPPPDSGVLA
jgi:hypothetical protein